MLRRFFGNLGRTYFLGAGYLYVGAATRPRCCDNRHFKKAWYIAARGMPEAERGLQAGRPDDPPEGRPCSAMIVRGVQSYSVGLNNQRSINAIWIQALVLAIEVTERELSQYNQLSQVWATPSRTDVRALFPGSWRTGKRVALLRIL